MGLPQRNKYTYEEFLEITKDEKYAEFINGEIFLHATPTLIHQHIVGRLYAKFLEYFEKKQNDCLPFIAPFDIIFENENETNKVQPDIFVLCGEKPMDKNSIKGVPTLVVEVLSPSNSSYDYIKKMDLYSRFGVKEYWIVSPSNKTVEIFSLTDEGVYGEPVIYFVNHIKSSLFVDLSIELDLLFK
ncbi:MAG: Uma2 family endonuclease [Clostridiales bacterium]|nr:Uma2 family endonuclease [Clostridiales bacterium]